MAKLPSLNSKTIKVDVDVLLEKVVPIDCSYSFPEAIGIPYIYLEKWWAAIAYLISTKGLKF